MMRDIEDGIHIKSNVRLELLDEQGNVKDVRETHNLVTLLGLYAIAAQILDNPAVTIPRWMELGTGSGGTSASSVLVSHISGCRTLMSKTRSYADVTMTCTFPAGVGTGAITEIGVFNSAVENSTDLITYADFGTINKGVNDGLLVTWVLSFV
jgi:hypothetical protein